jgi:hypothetical protein
LCTTVQSSVQQQTRIYTTQHTFINGQGQNTFQHLICCYNFSVKVSNLERTHTHTQQAQFITVELVMEVTYIRGLKVMFSISLVQLGPQLKLSGRRLCMCCAQIMLH